MPTYQKIKTVLDKNETQLLACKFLAGKLKLMKFGLKLAESIMFTLAKMVGKCQSKWHRKKSRFVQKSTAGSPGSF